MSLLDYLLGAPAGGNATADMRDLLVDDVIVHVHESSEREELSLCSNPGRVEGADWLSSRTEPWANVIEGTGHRSAIYVDPPSGSLMLLHMWPRAAMDHVAFREALHAHAHAHRAWCEVLAHPAQGADREQAGDRA
jgi:hypothetical protein